MATVTQTVQQVGQSVQTDFGSLALIIIIAAVGNVTGALVAKPPRQVAPIVLANAILFLVLAMVGSLWSFNVSKGVAVLYLIATLLKNGVALTNAVLALVNGVANTAGSK